jgi:hypothetical protein
MAKRMKQGMGRNDRTRSTQKTAPFDQLLFRTRCRSLSEHIYDIYDEFYRFNTMLLVSTVEGAFQNEPRRNRFRNDTPDLFWDSHVRRIIPTAPVSVRTESASENVKDELMRSCRQRYHQHQLVLQQQIVDDAGLCAGVYRKSINAE